MTFNSAFYLIDKEQDFTSFDVVQILRSKLKIKKIWHTWTLDPLATGALLVAVWKYTKLIPYFEQDTKEYEFVVNFDWESDSYDLWTEVRYISEKKQNIASKEINIEKLDKVLKENFFWEIKQVPPKYSALKIWWRKALHLVKEWEIFELKERTCTIHEIEILEYKYPSAKIRAKVSSWTYIRSIASDLWDIFWTWAYVSYLRRTKIGDLGVKNAIKINDVKKMDFISFKALFPTKDFIELDEKLLKDINDWKQIKWNFDFKKDVELFVLNGEILTNIIEFDWEKLIPKKKF